MKRCFLFAQLMSMVALLLSVTACHKDAQIITNYPTGAIKGLFSVSGSEQVYFSQGNLQYQASTNTWRFAEHQYDVVGNSNSNISANYSGWIDLFGWGTSGWNSGAICYQPWSTSDNSFEYYPGGSYTNNLTGNYANADWGVYNAISNGGSQAGLWRTLTTDEWEYVFNTRKTTSGIRYAKACVNGINGVILLSDYWNSSVYSLSSTNNSEAIFSNNQISASQWATMEQYGAVFLPAAGYRYEKLYYTYDKEIVGCDGEYWSSSSCNNSNGVGVYGIGFYDGYLNPKYWKPRYYGVSVRLVCSAQ